MDMKFSTLAQYSQYKDEIIKEIESAFHYDSDQSFNIDFYQLVKEDNLKNCHLLLSDNNEVIAHIGVRPVTLDYKGSEVDTIFIGGIVTKKEYQGQGHFKKLYEHTMAIYQDKCALVILWSDHDKLYQKFGFRPFGLTAVLGTEVVTQDRITSNQYTKANEIDYKLLAPLYNKSYKDSIKVKRDTNDWDEIAKITSNHLYVKKDSNKVTDYLFFEKGQDLKGIIHEISFTDNEKELSKFHQLQVLSPYLYDDESFYIHLAFGKVLNQKLFCEFINKISKNKLLIEFNQEFILKIDEEVFQIDQDEILPILFGPNQAQELFDLIPPIYISGADSI